MPKPAQFALATPVKTDSETSLRRLAALWDVRLDEGDACTVAARQNLRCLAVKGTLNELRQLDRPAVIRLRDDPAAPTYGLLLALDGKGATLEVAGKRQTVPPAQLENRYDGSFTTFWRAPPAWREQVTAGDRGAEVDWLAFRLAQLRGERRPADNEPLAGTTLAWLREFQAAQNLKADGVAGPKTFIRLSRLGDVREPRLMPAAAAAGTK